MRRELNGTKSKGERVTTGPQRRREMPSRGKERQPRKTSYFHLTELHWFKFVRGPSILIHRTRGVPVRGSTTTSRRIPTAHSVEWTDMPGDDIVTPQYALVGNSATDKERSNDLFGASRVRKPVRMSGVGEGRTWISPRTGKKTSATSFPATHSPITNNELTAWRAEDSTSMVMAPL